MRSVVAFACGVGFAVGLALSGMTQPAKILAFLDLFGHWDPSLALVMGGALATMALAKLVTPKRPLLAPSYPPLKRDGIDRRLVAGATLFGVGWGLVGFCPGPALASLGGGVSGSLVFVGAMIAGMAVHRVVTA